MNLEFDSEDRSELLGFEEEHQEYVLSRLKELRSGPTSHEDSGLIQVGGRNLFKYVMKEGSRGGRDFRAVYDVEQDSIKIFAIFHRDEGYDKDEIEDRL
ncbi:MAG: type II toxin-antitoxin system RelE/ParE family toxin [Candidatus Nanohaloarchaea archaeon]